jgi:GTP-binding protein YchF
MVKVPDPRLDKLAVMVKPRRVTHADVDYLDWGGVDTDPALAADLEAKVPGELRASDALVAVIRAFASDVVPHPRGSVDPQRDLADLQLALALADLTTVETRLGRIEHTLKVKKEPELQLERTVLEKCRTHLEQERPLREIELSREDARRIRGFELLSAKPLLVVINISESDIGAAGDKEQAMQAHLSGVQTTVIALSAQIEMEIAQLADAERKAFLEALGITEPALDRMIRASYRLLGLVSFFTATEPEARAWTVPEGTRAVEAAEAIHSDIARGFIRAEVVPYPDYVEHGGMQGAKQAGKFRLEGKDYVVQDGDVIYFRFNV